MAEVDSATRFQELFNEASKALLEYFRGGIEDPQANTKARIATSVISSYTRHEATESAKEQTRVLVARQLATNREEFERYIQLAMPQMHYALQSAHQNGNS